jgi:hypothetical protein
VNRADGTLPMLDKAKYFRWRRQATRLFFRAFEPDLASEASVVILFFRAGMVRHFCGGRRNQKNSS